MSPPCPPWSALNQGSGSLRLDGKYMYAAWTIVSIIRPTVVAMEMVSNLLNHPEWPTLRAFIRSKGYSIRFCESLDLAQILPQKRDRLLLIAVEDDSAFALNAHNCIKWPTASVPTLRSHQITMEFMLPWCLRVVPDQQVLKQYLDPALLPGASNLQRRTPNRQMQEVYDYRIRDLDSCFSCILTTYGHAHELDSRLLEKGGLYGALLRDAQALRFLQIPELLCLFGPTNAVWLPFHLEQATRIIGNSISVPHACIAMVNCLAFLRDITVVETGELFHRSSHSVCTQARKGWGLPVFHGL